jgi:cobalt-precorrin-5B (C1)-methyltransferase
MKKGVPIPPLNEAEADSRRNELKNPLRLGFSTGAAATAAALGAVVFLSEGRAPDRVAIKLPKGESLTINLAEASRDPSGLVRAEVVKDAGDDPDVTNGARVCASLKYSSTPGLVIAGGSGVGRVTKPGLVVAPGNFAINPVPTAMLVEHLRPFLPPGRMGLSVCVSIVDGERLALKTLNPRLGIVGGLSVLGTTGLVRPFSHAAYAATIESALKVARALGLTETVLTTGGRSEDLARKARTDLPEEAFVQIADFFKFGLKTAANLGFETIGLVSFFGKAVKQAAGEANTHARSVGLDLKGLALGLTSPGDPLRDLLSSAPTALAALEILKNLDRLSVVEELAERVVKAAARFAGPKVRLWSLIFDFDGSLLAQAFLPSGAL